MTSNLVGRSTTVRTTFQLVVLASMVLSTLLVPPAAAESSEGALKVTPTPELIAPENVVPIAARDLALKTDVTARDINLLNLAYWEQQGHVPPGTYALAQSIDLDADQRKEPAPPTFFLRDIHPVCDVDGDFIDDMVLNEFDLATGRPSVRMLSGADGHVIWIRYNTAYFPPGTVFPGYEKGTMPFFPWYTGLPSPQYPENFAPSIDINDDGVCDLFLINMFATRIGIDPVIFRFTIQYMMVNGTYGYFTLWSQSVESTVIVTFDPLGGGILTCIQMIDFPTGFQHFFTPNGPRWARKTTDAYFCAEGLVCPVFDWRSSDTVYVQDVTRWRIYWSRDINFTREYNPTSKSQEKVNNITYLSGMADLAGDDEYEAVLGQYTFTTPQTCGIQNPVDGSPLFIYGTGMNVVTLRGELNGGGGDLWKTPIYEYGTVRVNPGIEENFEIVLWVWVDVVNDVTGDKVPEVVATYLAVEVSATSPTTTNGRFRTHIHPLDGATGAKLWPSADVKLQGWGFVAGMNANYEVAVPMLAVGTVDFPTSVQPAGRFPPKDVRLSVFNTADGTPTWSYREQFATDGYIAYDMTLNQYRSALAPYDWNGDGIRDLVTPSQYVPASGMNQTLLANSAHRYSILDAREGLPLHHITAWGPTGLVVSCGYEPTLTVFSGHGRRYDVSRFNMSEGVDQTWRFPIFNNPDIQGATSGTDVIFVGPKCFNKRDGTTVFALNLAVTSGKRGREILNQYGLVAADGEDLEWIIPPVQGKPPVNPEDILKYFELDESHPSLTLALAASPALPGLVAGLGLGRLRSGRKNGGLE